jgi:ELWxxDGT repeat protein
MSPLSARPERRSLRSVTRWSLSAIARTLLIALSVAATAISLRASEPYLLKDVQGGLVNLPSFPESLTASGPFLYFFAEGANGRGLWRTDGTLSGTLFLKTGGLCTASKPVDVNGRLFLCINDGLWVSDGTVAGTFELSVPGSARMMVAYKNQLYFDVGKTLWRSDGTVAGTVPITDLSTGGAFFSSSAAVVGSRLFFSAIDGPHGFELWVTDGTAAGTSVFDLVTGPDSSMPSGLTNHNGVLFFHAWKELIGREWWKSDGTVPGTVLIKDIDPGGPYLAAESFLPSPATFQSLLVMPSFQADTGVEVWRTDGTEAGTYLVDDAIPGTESSYVTEFVTMEDGVYYAVRNTLRRTDGTIGGASVVFTFPYFYGISQLTRVGNRLFFTAKGELWVWSGGTATRVGGGDPEWPLDPHSLRAFGDRLFFAASDSAHGMELWSSEGSAETTRLFADLRVSTGDSEPHSFASLGERTVFMTRDGPKYTLWSTDGSSAGTTPLRSFQRFGWEIGTLDGLAFFAAEALEGEGSNGVEPWVTDGTAQGTRLLADLMPGQGSSAPSRFVAMRGSIFFIAGVPNPTALWKSQGTPESTVKVVDEAGFNLVQHEGLLYFTSSGGIVQLWTSDGSLAGTRAVNAPGSGHLVSSGSGVFAFVHESYRGSVLYAVDRNGGFTELAVGGYSQPVGTAGPYLVFYRRALQTGSGLWRTDGTPGGTQLIREELFPRDSSHDIPGVTVNGLLFFAGDDGVTGQHLWRTDGTEAGTRRVTDRPPLLYGRLLHLTEADGRLYFGYDFGGGVPRLFTSDGSTAGTHEVTANSGVTVAGHPAKGGSYLFFAGSEASTGIEPWALELDFAVSGFSPAKLDKDGGTTVTLRGRGFASGVTVFLGGALVPVTVVSNTEARIVAPPHAPGWVDLVVVAPDGREAQRPEALEYLCEPQLVAAASGGGAICSGQSMALAGSGGQSCLWYPAAGLSDPQSCTPAASPAFTTTYSLTVKNADGCTSVNNSEVTVHVSPTPSGSIIAPPGIFPNESGSSSVADAGPGATYSWTVNGATLDGPSNLRTIDWTAGCSDVSLGVEVTSADGCSSTGSFTSVMSYSPAILTLTPASGRVGESVVIQGPGIGCTSALRFNGIPASFEVLNLREIRATIPVGARTGFVEVATPKGTTRSVFPFNVVTATGFYPVPPCRLVDTRGATGPRGGPPIFAGTARSFAAGGHCGVPMDAKSISVNVTVVPPASYGFLTLFASDVPLPLASTVNYAPSRTRANNAVVVLSTDGAAAFAIFHGGSSGANVIVDVNGYFK